MSPRRVTTLLSLSLLLSLAGCRSQPVPAPRGAVPSRTEPKGMEGLASWYGGRDGFEGKPTASGEIYDSSQLTAAHRELPFGSVVDVTNTQNGKTVRVRINDRGPFIRGRVIDLSRAAAEQIELLGPGIGQVRLDIVAPGIEPTVRPGSVLWAVQVGSFADRARAERHAERVRATGHGVFLEPYQGLSRVKLGPYDSRADAENVLEEIREAGYEGIVVPADDRS